MQEIDFYQVDAFTPKIFGGNPAAVCPLQEWLPDHLLLAITREHNQSETAFFVPTPEGFELRWFTSLGEINLCGHATLASAHVIFNHLNYPKDKIEFSTRFVGNLTVELKNNWLTLNFPAWNAPVTEVPPEAIAGLNGLIPKESYLFRDYLFVYPNEDIVRQVKPDFKILALLKHRVCISAEGKDCDFVSRFFCAGDAVEEDPVTGSAHCMLIPYWSKRLNKTKLQARQLSYRGGELRCEMLGERVLISGQAETYMKGRIFLSPSSFQSFSNPEP